MGPLLSNLPHMLNLTAELLFGQGRKRACYHHPEREDVCVKVDLVPSALANKEAAIEVAAHQRVIARGQQSASLSLYLGLEESNLGRADLFQLVRENDGSLSPTLRSCKEELNEDSLRSLLREFYESCYTNDYVIGDLHSQNLLVQNNERLVLVDGLGAVDFLPIYYLSKKLRRMKLNRKMRKLCRRLGLEYEQENSFWLLS